MSFFVPTAIRALRREYFIVFFLLLSMGSAQADPLSCSFNWDRRNENWRTGEHATQTQRESPSGRPNQGYVEDFRNRMSDRPYELWSAGINRLLGNEGCEDNERQEFISVECSGAAGNGYFYPIRDLNIDGLVNYWDESTEELVFQTGVNEIHNFATCQQGVFQQYFGNPQVQLDLQRDAHNALNQIVQAYSEMENVRRTRGMTGTHAPDSWIDEQIARLVSRVPMGNRDIMRDALVNLLKYHAVPNPNDPFRRKHVPFGVFQTVYNQQMMLMSQQTETTLDKIEGPRNSHGVRAGGIVDVGDDGQKRYCIDTDLKTYLWRSGQIGTVVSQYGVAEELTPGFMCRGNNRYGRTGAYAAEMALIPTYFLGYGAARLAVRAGIAGFRAATSAGEIITGTRLMMLGLEGADWLTTANAISNDCNMEEMFVNVNKFSCDPATELTNVYQEAKLSQCLTTAFVSGTTLFAGAAARMLAGRTIRSADDVIRDAREARYADIDSPENVITVTARASRETPRHSPRPASNAIESRTLEVTDEIHTRNELDEILSSLGGDTAAAQRRLSGQGVERFLANEGRSLPQAKKDRLRIIARRIEHHDEIARSREVSSSDIDQLAQQLSLPTGARDTLRLRLDRDNVTDFREVVRRTGTKANDQEKVDFIFDQLTGLSYYSGAQRTRAMDRLVDAINQWDNPSVRGRISLSLLRRRNQRMTADVDRATTQIKAANPALSDNLVRSQAENIALARRERRLVLHRACTDTRRGGNAISAQAGRRFSAGNLYLGVGSAAVNFSIANWNQVKDSDWAKRLGYEVVQSFIISKWGGRISRTQSSGLGQKILQGLTMSTTLSGMEASVYSSFFGGNERRARENLVQLQNSPNLEADLAALEEYVANRSGIEEAVDGVSDFGSNLLRQITGRESVSDLTIEEIRQLDSEALQNPEVMERVMDTIEDQLYAEDLGGNTWGNQFLDRIAYGAEWNFNPVSGVPRGVLVGMASYYAFCRNIDNPMGAMAAMGMIQGTNQLGAGFFYYSGRAEEINQ